MEDINNMSLKDFYGLSEFVHYRNYKSEGKRLPLKDSQKDMIRRAGGDV